MKEIPRWVWGAVCVGVLYFLVDHPDVFGAVFGIGFLILAAVFFIGGFFYYLRLYDLMPPWWALFAFGVLCILRPALLGVVIGVGWIGGLTFVIGTFVNSLWDDGGDK